MANQKMKKYRMTEIPAKLSEKGGYTASFVSDGYTVNGRVDILPRVLLEGGMKMSEGVAWDLIHNYTVACLAHTATTGETVDMGDSLTMLSIRGWYEKRDSRALRENVRVIMRLKKEMRPQVTFSMSNTLDGRVLTLYSVTTPGCEPDFVKQGGIASIHGLWLKMLDGDTVTAMMKDASRQEVVAACEIISSQDDRIDVRVPSAFDGEQFIGQSIVFEVTNSCGLADRTEQTKKIPATLLAGNVSPTPPEPVGVPSITNAKSTGYGDRTVNIGGGDLTVEGENLETATQVKLLDPDGTPFFTVPVRYEDGKLVAPPNSIETEGPGVGSVEVTTEGGRGTLDVTFTTP